MKDSLLARRSLMSGLGVATALALTSKTSIAQAPERQFQPARHSQDAWLNAVRGTHRNFIDASTATGAGEAMLYANNIFEANKTGYSIAENDIAIVVCLRHFATVFAFNDVMWGKYGKQFSTIAQFTDPKTKAAPSTNLLNSAGYGMALSNLGNTIDSVVKRGAQFAVCDMATRFFSGQIAASGGNADAVYKELVANRIPNSHMVAAGVVAVNRAQEYGYSLLTTL
jgi:hypothetical protein